MDVLTPLDIMPSMGGTCVFALGVERYIINGLLKKCWDLARSKLANRFDISWYVSRDVLA